MSFILITFDDLFAKEEAITIYQSAIQALGIELVYKMSPTFKSKVFPLKDKVRYLSEYLSKKKNVKSEMQHQNSRTSLWALISNYIK